MSVGKSIASAGWACLAYEWGYLPFCHLIHADAWSLTTYGLVSIGIGFALNITEAALQP